ncbi:OTUD6B [Bugula neritina]|uniref:OTUD6B n=1 Tax=Bugula neritina TaxID=10212 RepID=A0A7J7JS02_BUGNE|nr:OTUD6B [Bugula neritina]
MDHVEFLQFSLVVEIMEATDLAIKHKQERKELQAKAQKIKHAVPKGDKKRLKETKQEIAKLEMELDAKHQQELQEQELKDSTAAVTLEEKNLLCGGKVGAVENTVGKKSKAAKRRVSLFSLIVSSCFVQWTFIIDSKMLMVLVS